MKRWWYPIILICVAAGYLACLLWVRLPLVESEAPDPQRISIKLVAFTDAPPLIPVDGQSPEIQNIPSDSPGLAYAEVDAVPITTEEFYQEPVLESVVEQISPLKSDADVVETESNDPLQAFYSGFNDVQEATVLPQLPLELVRKRLEYPPLAKRQGREGLVLLQLYISAQGVIELIEILDDPGFGMAEAAIQAFEGIVSVPAYRDGKPIAVRMRYPIRFLLE